MQVLASYVKTLVRRDNQIVIWLKSQENRIFFLLILFHLLGIWCFDYFPSQDGPTHVHNASVLREYYLPEYSVLRKYYIFNPNLAPNWFSHLVMAGLMYVFSPAIAEKVFLSGYIILLPISVRYAIEAINSESTFIAFLSFPFIYNLTLHLGFYNFCYSLVLFFILIGYWLKHQQQLRWKNLLILGLLSLLLYSCHIFSTITVYVALAILMVWLAIFESKTANIAREFNWEQFLFTFFKKAIFAFCCFFPTLILVLQFLLQKQGSKSQGLSFFSVPELLSLLRLNSLLSYDKIELLFSLSLVGLFITVSLYYLNQKINRHQLNKWDGLFLVFVAYVIIYFIAPSRMYDSVTIKERMMLYPFFALILWLGGQTYSYVIKQRIKILAISITLLLLVVHTWQYFVLNDYLKEYLSGRKLIEPNSTVLAINFSYYGSTITGEPLFWQPYGRFLFFDQPWQINPFLHATGYLAAQKHLVDLNNYQANLKYFPINFRPELNPFKYLYLKQSKTTLAENPGVPKLDLLTYQQQTDGRIDYIIIWQLQAEQKEYSNTKAIFQQLNQNYDLIFTSPPRGLMELYRLKDGKFQQTSNYFPSSD